MHKNPTQSIRHLVLSDHLDTWLKRSTGGPYDYKVFLVQSHSEVGDEELTKLSKNGVRVAIGKDNIAYNERGEVLEKASGFRAVLFDVDVKFMSSNEAIAESSAITGELGGEFFTYRLIRKTGVWKIVSKISNGHASLTLPVPRLAQVGESRVTPMIKQGCFVLLVPGKLPGTGSNRVISSSE